jgi:phosphoribosylamine--glycine ligase
MDVLIVGGGGREAALAWKIAQSPLLGTLWTTHDNPGFPAGARRLGPGPVAQSAADAGVDLVVVGPEQPLAEGLVDQCRALGVAAFGPTAAAARMEASKGFAKDFMARHGIPTAGYGRYADVVQARAAITGPCVVKADGLAAGKGVFVCPRVDQAIAAVETIFESGLGADDTGIQVVIEELLVGEELSVLALVDGERMVVLPAAQDHKRRFDGDQGPNTGGMGAYAPAPAATPELLDQVRRQVLEPTVAGMAAEGMPFTGVLYAGIMVTAQGPKVLEFNCRFGDPECQPLLMLLDEDLLPLLMAASTGSLVERPLRIRAGAACCVVMVSDGYPGSYPKGQAISGLRDSSSVVFHAGTRSTDAGVETNGGRVLGVTALGSSIRQARAQAYADVARIHFHGASWRTDIANRALAREERDMASVAILMGSKSDLSVMEGAESVLSDLGIPFETRVLSAHRTPDEAVDFARDAEGRGVQVIIAGAGMAAHLAGVMAGVSNLPVIGVPVGASFMGLDALLATVQMPPGVPVATVAVGRAGAKNAAWLAARIMALSDEGLRARLAQAKVEMRDKVLADDATVRGR